MKELIVGIAIAFPVIFLIGLFVGKKVMMMIMDAFLKYEREDDDATGSD